MPKQEFNTGEPLAYFITWTTYGTWLPGDKRGWRRRNVPDLQPPDDLYVEMSANDMKETAYVMSPSDRKIVEETIHRHCEIRKWVLHAVNARSNHVHVVVSAPRYKPDIVRNQFKAWCTRKLKSEYPKRQRFWTEGASCRWLNSDEDLDSAVEYSPDEVQNRKWVEDH